ncbi:unnamed protein product [Phyllotreta striolata]|uniref:Gustatory receptor n=1 Tax=Phyllotreta striolata TaxID=444603 RepID=A0A9N9TQC1_PHYSR|nr:unnamed protein product [Phyllotreta striolata]
MVSFRRRRRREAMKPPDAKQRKPSTVAWIEMAAVERQDAAGARNRLHEGTKPVVRAAQLFGVMPLRCIAGDWDGVRFEWRSIAVAFSALNAAGAFLSMALWLVKFCVDGIVVDKTVYMAFYFCTFLCTVHFMKVARNWPSILKEWSFVETTMKNYGTEENLKRKFLWMGGVSFLVGTVEHILFIINGLYQSEVCDSFSRSRFRATMEVLFSNYFTFFSFNTIAGVLIKMINVLATFTWIYTDLFISIVSHALTVKFRQFVTRIKTNTDRVGHQKFWREIREDYQKLYGLCKKVDKCISFLVLVSFMHNIFFLCIQLYNSLKQRKGLIETAYFVYSFAFLVFRIIAVSMYGALLHDEAQKPLEYLHNVPTEYYCSEVRRLINQIYTCPVGITGSGFFVVSRNFMLQIAGTIVTFELMLFQFAPIDSKNRIYNKTEICIND